MPLTWEFHPRATFFKTILTDARIIESALEQFRYVETRLREEELQSASPNVQAVEEFLSHLRAKRRGHKKATKEATRRDRIAQDNRSKDLQIDLLTSKLAELEQLVSENAFFFRSQEHHEIFKALLGIDSTHRNILLEMKPLDELA
jgi:hypothetical protein